MVKKVIILGLIIVVATTIIGICFAKVYYDNNMNNLNNSSYVIKYQKEVNDNNSYIINLSNKNNIQVQKTFCVFGECRTSNYSIKITNNNKHYIDTLISELFVDNKLEVDIKGTSDVTSASIATLNAIASNDTDYFNNNNQKPSKELLFTLTSDRINCEPVYLEVFKDKTYLLHLSKCISNNCINPEAGTYTYDVTKIKANNNLFANSLTGSYILKENNTKYEIYDTNIYLHEFLQEIGINLDACINQD